MITFSSWVYRTNVQMYDIFIQLRGNSNQVKKNKTIAICREFVVAAFKYIGKEIEWSGSGDQEV